MEAAEAKHAKETLELAFQMSNILETGLDRHTLSLVIVLCDRGLNPEALSALVRQLSSRRPAPDLSAAAATTTATSSYSSRPNSHQSV